MSRAGAFVHVVSFKVWSRKKYDKSYVVLEVVSLRGETISSHSHRTGSWFLLGVLFKNSKTQPLSLLYGSPPTGLQCMCANSCSGRKGWFTKGETFFRC